MSGLPKAAYAFLVVLCLVLYLPGFTTLPPFDRDESRFAQASTQMLETGDLVDIRFQDEARWKKPAGIYWLQSAATAVLEPIAGREIWTYRVPSLVGVIVAVLMTAWLGARLFDPTTGLMAAIMLASAIVVGVEARMAKTDAVLLATIVAAQAALGALYIRRDRAEPVGWGLPLLFWIAAGISVLIKGPLIALVSGATVAVLAVTERRVAWLKSLRPLAGLGIVLLIAAPWLIAITLKTHGAFFEESVGHDMLGKVASGQEGKGLPPGYYLLTFLVTFAPWSFLTIAALPWIWRNRQDDVVRFCLAWIIPTWLVFEAIPTKLLHYTLPVFPAIALLTASALLDDAGQKRGKTFWIGVALGGLGFVGVAVAVAVVPLAVDGRLNPWGLLAAPVSTVLFGLFVRQCWRGEVRKAVPAGLTGAVVLYVAAYALVLPAVDGLWIARSAQNLLAEAHPCEAPSVAAAGYSEPSLVFLLGTETRLVEGGAAAEHLLNGPACRVSFVESRQENAFRAALGGREPKSLGTVTGFNYNNGRRIVLTLYAPPA